jgi:VWFA-related protein
MPVLEILLALLALLPAPSGDLPEPYRVFLEHDARFLILPAEREVFLQLREDYQRDLFIEEFWRRRDPFPDTPRNEFKEGFLARLEEGEALFGPTDPRTRVLAVQGAPDQRIVIPCEDLLYPSEVWIYRRIEEIRQGAALLFFQRFGIGPYVLYDGHGAEEIRNPQGGTMPCFELTYVSRAIQWTDHALLDGTFSRFLNPPPVDLEGLTGIFARTTFLPEGMEPLKAALSLDFRPTPGPRTLVEGTVVMEEEGLGGVDVVAEFLREGKVWASARYRFQYSAGEERLFPATFLAEVFPGAYDLRVKVTTTDGKRGAVLRQTATVPAIDRKALLRPDGVATPGFALQGVSAQAPASGLLRVGVPDLEGVRRVEFLLDDKVVGVKNAPPFDLELDLGPVPLPRVMTARGLDAAGKEVARDTLVLNQGMDSFLVRIVEPAYLDASRPALPFKAQVVVPQNRTVKRLAVYQEETLLAELFAPPWATVLRRDPAGSPVIRAVAELDDGRKVEDATVLSASPFGEKLRVSTVHLYVTVTDGQGRPVADLPAEAFTVAEDGDPQTVTEFQRAENLPANLCFLIDSSESMDKALFVVKRAVEMFIKDYLAPGDAAFLVDFDTFPRLLLPFTARKDLLLNALNAVTSDGSTALYDSVVFSLYHFQGRPGRGAIVLLTDGRDTVSSFSFDDALRFIRRSGVIVYALALNIKFTDLEVKGKLMKLTEASGGRLFSIGSDEIAGSYAAIGKEIRSQYHLVYTSTHTGSDFRSVKVTVKGGYDARTIAGYYP